MSDREPPRADGDGAASGAGDVTAGDGAATDVSEEASGSAGDPLEEVFDRPAAAAGLVAAGLALAAAFLQWTGDPVSVAGVGSVGSPLGAVLAGVAVVGFLGDRHGGLGRERAGALAVAGGGGVVLVALYEFVAPATGGGSPPTVGSGLVVAAAGGLLSVGFGLAHARGTPGRQLLEMARRTGVATALLVVTLFVVYLVVAPLPLDGLDPLTRLAVAQPLTDLVFVAVGLAFLLATGRGLEYVDLRMPDVRDLAYVGIGLVALVGGFLAISVTVQYLGLPSADNRIAEPAMDGNTEILLLLIPMSFLVVGPAEELLYRNVVQKYLAGTFSQGGAVVVASGLFAAAHLPSYASANPVATLVSLLIVFVLSLVLGAVYARTRNLLVPAFIHGTYNAALFALLYYALTYGDPEQLAVGLPW